MGLKQLHEAMDLFDWYRTNNNKKVQLEVYIDDKLDSIIEGTLRFKHNQFEVEEIKFEDCIIRSVKNDQTD